MIKRFWSVFLLILFYFPVAAQQEYVREINIWHKDRIDALKAPNGWLNLEGLFWLHAGTNSFGSSPGNDLVVTDIAFPSQAGKFILENSLVRWESSPGIQVVIGEQSGPSGIIYSPATKKQLSSQLGNFVWTIIKREEKIGVRFRNLSNEESRNFRGIERYPVDEKWKVQAKLMPANEHGLAVTNVLGQSNFEKSPGKLQFILNGTNYTLDAIDEGDDNLFIVFGDQTNGETTYPSGRFIYVAKPGADGLTSLDFNKAINPPCAFTDFATCPIPPRQNILLLAINAGEKNYHKK